MVSRKVFCGARRPLITGILVRVDCVLRTPLRPAGADSCSAPNPGKNLDVPGAHPRPCRSAPIRDTRGSTLAAQQWPYPSTENPHICLIALHKESVNPTKCLSESGVWRLDKPVRNGSPGDWRSGEATAHWCRVDSSVPPGSFLSTSIILLPFSSCYNQQQSCHVGSADYWDGEESLTQVTVRL